MTIRPHPSFYDYGADEEGNIYSFKCNKTKLKKIYFNNSGYNIFTMYAENNYKTYLVHRFVWECYHNRLLDPYITLDHRNNKKYDNRIKNLIEMKRRDNIRKGDKNEMYISRYKSYKKYYYMVQITLNKKQEYIGTFKNKKDAINARNQFCNLNDILL